jgi:hypothetical protein
MKRLSPAIAGVAMHISPRLFFRISLYSGPAGLDDAAIIRELESGRPVLLAVRLPSIYVQNRTFPGANAPVLSYAGGILSYRVGQVSELTGLEMVDHYVLVVGYDEERWVVVEPVMGYRTISHDKLARYRRPFNNAAIVFSGPPRQGQAGPTS